MSVCAKFQLSSWKVCGSAVLPNGPIFSDFGPESDFFEQNGPELVRITPQKSGLGGNK